MRILFFVLGVLCTTTGLCNAASHGDLVGGEKVQWESREYRVELSKAIAFGLETINQVIPNVSPNDQQWIEKELARIESIADFGNRSKQRVALNETVPYMQYISKKHLASIISGTKCIETPNITIKNEMACWAFLSTELLYRFTWTCVLELSEQGKITLPQTPETIPIYSLNNPIFPEKPSYWPHVIAEGIVQYIILPYLVKEANAKTN